MIDLILISVVTRNCRMKTNYFYLPSNFFHSESIILVVLVYGVLTSDPLAST